EQHPDQQRERVRGQQTISGVIAREVQVVVHGTDPLTAPLPAPPAASLLVNLVATTSLPVAGDPLEPCAMHSRRAPCRSRLPSGQLPYRPLPTAVLVLLAVSRGVAVTTSIGSLVSSVTARPATGNHVVVPSTRNAASHSVRSEIVTSPAVR